MAPRPRTLLLVLSLGFSAVLLPAGAAGARPGQDPSVATFGGAGAAATSTTIATSSSSTTAVDATQTVVESKDPPATRLVTESRKVMAVIAGLLLVALGLLVLTIRYWRVTRPVAVSSIDDLPTPVPPPVLVATATEDELEEYGVALLGKEVDFTALNDLDDDIWFGGPTSTAAAAASDADAPTDPAADETKVDDGGGEGPDHAAADTDWEPHTGEHERVEVPAGARLARPSAEARRRALGLPDAP